MYNDIKKLWLKFVYKLYVTSIRKNQVVSRQLKPNRNDIFIVSYPKSGNTWLRFLLANMVCDESITFDNINNHIPDIYQVTFGDLNKIKHPAIFKSHEPFNPSYMNVIYLVRNPVDVAFSLYNWGFNRQGLSIPISDFVDKFLYGTVQSGYGTWGEHVGSWMSTANPRRRLLLIQYEAMLNEPCLYLRKISNYFDLQPEKDLYDAIERSNPENMKKLEANKSRKIVRNATCGDGKNYLSEEDQNRINNQFQKALKLVGY